jgi:hypothetical protein
METACRYQAGRKPPDHRMINLQLAIAAPPRPVQPGVAEVVFVQDARMGKVIEAEIAQGDLGCYF